MTTGLKMAYKNGDFKDSGFIENRQIHFLSRETLIDLVSSLQNNCMATASALSSNSGGLTQQQCGKIFQYFFDRTVEMFYKKLKWIDTDGVVVDAREALGNYEPDVPRNLQEIIAGKDLNIGIITTNLWRYMEEKKIFDLPFGEWFTNYLVIATAIGLAFAQEIEFEE